MKRKEHKGVRIPPEFRRKVSARIRQVMQSYIAADTLTGHCKEAAADLELYYMTLWFWYNGYCLPTIYNLVRFADYYDVSLDYLLGRRGASKKLRIA